MFMQLLNVVLFILYVEGYYFTVMINNGFYLQGLLVNDGICKHLIHIATQLHCLALFIYPMPTTTVETQAQLIVTPIATQLTHTLHCHHVEYPHVVNIQTNTGMLYDNR